MIQGQTGKVSAESAKNVDVNKNNFLTIRSYDDSKVYIAQ